MKSHFNRLVPSFIVALSFASSQASWGMEDDTFPQFSNLPKVLQKHILEFDAYNRGKKNKHFSSNKSVCKYWKNLCETNNSNNNIKNAWHEGRLAHLEKNYSINNSCDKEVLKKIYNGKLIYTDPETEKTTELLIADLYHPLEGEFKLPGDAGNYLSIYMGYRKGKNSKNAEKVEIWFAPRFLIAKDLDTTASHFKPIMDNWKPEQAPVGIFFTWGGCDNFDTYYALTCVGTARLHDYSVFEWTTFNCVTRRGFPFNNISKSFVQESMPWYKSFKFSCAH
jgi:hypothetical protein